MRILLWHGYLLRGSGSNIYTSNIARSWRSRGHDVLVLCQETDVTGLSFVDEIGAFDTSNETMLLEPTGVESAGGRCRVVRPFIAGLLPVYVYDEYPGFLVKTFVDLTDHELARYTGLNVAALSAAIDRFDPDVIVTGHEVMGPHIAARATSASGRPFLAKLHGSALEYAVKKQDRYRMFAIEGLGAARRVAGGSEYMIREASSYIPGWEDRAVVINPGCDTDLFYPRPVEPHPPTIGFVGKFLEAKGVHHLLAALPLVDVEDLRAVIVGFGGYEPELRELAASILSSDRARSRRLTIEFPGRLEHGPLSQVLPSFDLLAVPSIVPEAFGMVAAEAAASAVLPVVPGHSGIGEVGRAIEHHLGRPGLLVYDHTDAIASLAARIQAVLGLPSAERRELGLAASALAGQRWSWDHVADRLLEEASG